MTFEYISVDDAIERAGTRMVVVGNVPSSWGEAAKGFWHIKRLPFAAVRLVYDNAGTQTLGRASSPARWSSTIVKCHARAGQRSSCWRSGSRQRPRCCRWSRMRAPGRWGWPTNSAAPVASAGHDACRMCTPDSPGPVAFPRRVAGYLGKKYGYDPAQGASYGARVCAVVRRVRRDAARAAGRRPALLPG